MNGKSEIRAWIEAMRLRTLPVSVAGVFAGTACAAAEDSFRWLPALICLVFAALAQIVSNFANEYYDFKNGLDRKGREGFRRGVTEGDLSPASMKRATFILLAADCLIGFSLVAFGGWEMIPVGIAIALFALAYSAGPYPLSHHGLGEIAVIIFFGIIPVTLTCWLQTQNVSFSSPSLPVSVAVGLMGANVLMVNNYRDADDDRSVGKRTIAVRFGRGSVSVLYLLSGIIASVAGSLPLLPASGYSALIPGFLYLILHLRIWSMIGKRSGSGLNPLLGMTAMNMFIYSLLLLIVAFV